VATPTRRTPGGEAAAGTMDKSLSLDLGGDEIVMAGPSRAEEEAFVDETGKFALQKDGPYAVVRVHLEPNETFKAEAGAMMAMDDEVEMMTGCDGGCCQATIRRWCSGEGMCITTYRAPAFGKSGDVVVAPNTPGDILLLTMTGGPTGWMAQKGAFLCADPEVSVGTQFVGCMNGCMGKEGFFLCCLRGPPNSRAIINSYGSMIKYTLAPGEERIVDNGNAVCWEENMEVYISTAAGLVASCLSGEGIVSVFKGPGVVYVQTRTIAPLAALVSFNLKRVVQGMRLG